MKRLALFTLVCCLIFAAIGGIATFIGRANPSNTDLIPGFTTCSNIPCYMGIVPDKTSVDQFATMIASASFRARQLDTNYYALPDLKTSLRLLSSDSGGMIDHLQITLDTGNNLRIGDVIRRFGIPCDILRGIGIHWIVMRYPYLGIYVAMDEQGSSWDLNPASRVFEIRLIGGPPKDCFAVGDGNIVRWRGFTRY